MDYELKGVRPRGRPKKAWSEVIAKDCPPKKICKEDDMDRRKWRKLVKDVLY